MSLTPHQLKQREGRITASRVPAILGVDPWCSPRQAYLIITGQATSEAGEAADLGTAFEAGILAHFAKVSGRKIVKRNVTRSAGGILATLDAVTDEPAIVEAKSNWSPFNRDDEWGEPGTDEVPERHLVQTAAQFVAAPEMQVCHLPRLHAASKLFAVYRIMRDPRLIEAVTEGVRKFDRDHLQTGVPPAPDHRDVEVLQAVERRADKEALIPPALLTEYVQADAEADLADEHRKAIRARILEAMKVGDDYADAGVCEVGKVTYRRTKDGMKFDMEAFEAAHADLVAKFQKPKPGYRVFRVSPKKG